MRSRIPMAACLIAALSACATFGFGRKPSPQALQAFAKAVDGMSPDEAKKIADKAGIDRETRLRYVLPAMRKLSIEGYVMTADAFGDAFEIDRGTLVTFAQGTFDELVRSDKCEYASDVAFWFDLGPKYADAAVQCLVNAKKGVYEVAGLACHRPGTERLVIKRQKEALAAFTEIPRGMRDYDVMRTLIGVCRYDAADLLALYRLGLEDGALELARDVLDQADSRGFKWADGKRWVELFDAMLAAGRIDLADMLLHSDELPESPDVLKSFIDGAVAHHECGRAVRAAIEGKSPDAAIAGIFGHAKCFGADFVEIAGTAGEKDAPKFLDLALAYGKFSLARRLVDRLPDGKAGAEKRVEAAALAAFAFDDVMAFEPFPGEAEADRRERLLGTILGMKEEWFVARWLTTFRRERSYPEDRFNGWIERCFVSALLRGAHDLAADVAMLHTSAEFGKKGAQLAFEEAIEAEDADGAFNIAKRWKLGDDAMRQVALLKHRLMMKAEREKAKLKRKKQKKKDPDDWNP